MDSRRGGGGDKRRNARSVPCGAYPGRGGAARRDASVEPRVEREVRTVLLAGACGRRPLGRFASEASPDVSTDRRSGMTSFAPLPSGAGRSEATTALCGSSYWQDGLALSSSRSWVRLHVLGSERGADRPSPVSSWHRARFAMIRRRRCAARPRTRPRVSRQRPMSGCAAIGLALGRVASAQNCSQPKDQEDDRPTRLARRDEPYDAVVATLLPAPLRKRCHGVIPAKGGADAGARFARAPGAADPPANWTSGMAEPLARSGEPTRLPGERPSSLTSRRSTRRYRAPASHASSGRANRPPGRRVRAPALGPVRAR